MGVVIREPDEGSQTTQQGMTHGVHGQGSVDRAMRQAEPVVPASRASQDIPIVIEKSQLGREHDTRHEGIIARQQQAR
ncbi:hypothetical protein ACLOJK_004360, partial [Asimina triloba]